MFRTFFANFEELCETKFRTFEEILYMLLYNILNNSIRNSALDGYFHLLCLKYQCCTTE